MAERDQKDRIAELETAFQELSLLHGLTSKLIQNHPLEPSIIQEFVSTFADGLNLDVVVWIDVEPERVDPDGCWIQRCPAAVGVSRIDGTDLHLDEKTLGAICLESPGCVSLEAGAPFGGIDHIFARLDPRPPRGWISTLQSGERFHGVLLMAGSREEFTASETQLVESIAQRAGHALNHTSTTHRLRKSQERYRLAVGGTHDGIWDWNVESSSLYVSARWLELNDLMPGLDLTLDDWLARIHPEDRPELRRALDAHLSGETDRFAEEYRILRSGQPPLWIHGTAQAVRDEDGAPTRIVGSESDITQRKTAELQFQYAATHDATTDLPNRSLLLERLIEALENPNSNTDLLLAMNMDQFSVVNDISGYRDGDRVLREIRDRLHTFTTAGDTIARLQGDTFVVLFRDLPKSISPKALWERMCNCLADPFDVSGRKITLTASAGMVLLSEEYKRGDDALLDAHTAMFSAKRKGRGTFAMFQPAMRAKAIENWELMSDLPSALETDDIFLVYQPILSMKSGLITGFEALVRWNHPRHGVVPPGIFIPVAEETGMIIPLGRVVLRQAAEQARRWERTGMPVLPISVNLAPEQFSRGHIVEAIAEEIRDAKLPRGALMFEITERTVVDTAADPAEVIKRIQNLGSQVVIDDFGTGYSSLNYLIHLGVNGLKLDRSFVTGLDRDPQQQRVVGAVIRLAHSLDLSVTAEGIEEDAERIVLQALGCDHGQGFLFHRPMDVGDATALLQGLSRAHGANPESDVA